MSANNWRICPKCEKDTRKRVLQQEDVCSQLATDNGTVREYVDAQEHLAELQKQLREVLEEGETFREDYEFWFVDTELRWQYAGHCDRCGFSRKVHGSKDGEE